MERILFVETSLWKLYGKF